MQLFVLVLLVALAAPASAEDTIELKNGDELTGTIIEKNDAVLVFEHAAPLKSHTSLVVGFWAFTRALGR